MKLTSPARTLSVSYWVTGYSVAVAAVAPLQSISPHFSTVLLIILSVRSWQKVSALILINHSEVEKIIFELLQILFSSTLILKYSV